MKAAYNFETPYTAMLGYDRESHEQEARRLVQIGIERGWIRPPVPPDKDAESYALPSRKRRKPLKTQAV